MILFHYVYQLYHAENLIVKSALYCADNNAVDKIALQEWIDEHNGQDCNQKRRHFNILRVDQIFHGYSQPLGLQGIDGACG